MFVPRSILQYIPENKKGGMDITLFFFFHKSNFHNDMFIVGRFMITCVILLFFLFLYARLKNGTYYVTGYGIRPSVNFFVSC